MNAMNWCIHFMQSLCCFSTNHGRKCMKKVHSLPVHGRKCLRLQRPDDHVLAGGCPAIHLGGITFVKYITQIVGCCILIPNCFQCNERSVGAFWLLDF